MNTPEMGEATPTTPEVTSSQTKTSEVLNSQSAIRSSMHEWQRKHAMDLESRPNPIAAASAAESRQRYRLVKAVEGKTVRPYNKHGLAPFQPGETHEDHLKRTHKERQRAYRNTTAETVRVWTDLSLLSEEEKANHIREKNRERQRKARQKLKTKDIVLDPVLIKWMEDFE